MVAEAAVVEIERLMPVQSPALSFRASVTPMSLGLLKVITMFCVACRLNRTPSRLPASMMAVPVAVRPPEAVQSTRISRGAAWGRCA